MEGWGTRGRRIHSTDLLIPLVVLLCGLTYLVCTPFGGAPDEVSHFVRTVGLSEGQVFGRNVPSDTPYGAFQGDKLRMINLEAGYFDVRAGVQTLVDCEPTQVSGEPWTCPAPGPDNGSVRAISHHAASMPVSYLFPAVLTRFANGTSAKFVLARLGFLVQNVLLAVAIAVAGRRASLRWNALVVAGIVVSVTPVFLWQVGLIAPNSTENLALIAFATALAAAVRQPQSRWWCVAALLVAPATWTRDLGFFYVPSIVILLLASSNGRKLVQQLPRARQTVIGLAVASASLAGFLWRLAYNSPTPSVDLSAHSIWLRVARLRTLSIDAIGRVGILNIPTQSVVTVVWPIVFVIVWGLLAARSRHWARVVTSAVLYWAVVNIVLNLVQSARGFTWFGTQARYTSFVPVVFLVLGLATEPHERIENRAGGPLTDRAVLWAASIAASLCHFITFIYVHHRWANGLAHPLALRHSSWSPPGGWALGVAMSAAATLMILLAPLWFPAGEKRRASTSERST